MLERGNLDPTFIKRVVTGDDTYKQVKKIKNGVSKLRQIRNNNLKSIKSDDDVDNFFRLPRCCALGNLTRSCDSQLRTDVWKEN